MPDLSAVWEFLSSKPAVAVESFIAGVMMRPLQRQCERWVDRRRLRRSLYQELAMVYDDLIAILNQMHSNKGLAEGTTGISNPRYTAAWERDPFLYHELREAVALSHAYMYLKQALKDASTTREFSEKFRVLEEAKIRVEHTVLRRPFSRRLFYGVASANAKLQVKSREDYLRRALP